MAGESDVAATWSPEKRIDRLDLRIAELAQRQHGVVSLRQLVARGLSPRAVRDRVAAGRLHRIHRAIYAVGYRKLTKQGWWMAAVLFGGEGSALSFRCAGAHWNLRAWSGRAQITVPTWRRGPGGIELHTSSLPADEVTVRGGIAVTTVSRTILDLATVLDGHALLRVIEEAEIQRLSDPLPLTALLARHRGERGAGRLRSALASAGRGRGVTRSELEELFARFVAEFGLPHPELNATLHLDGRFIHPDCLWRARRLVVELDGAAFHGTGAAITRDAGRDRLLLLAGYTVVHVTWAQLADVAERRALAEDLRALLSLSGRSGC